MVQLARRPDRPTARDYVDRMFVHFVELHGDRLQGDDPAIVAGIGRLAGITCMVVAQQKGADGDAERAPENRSNPPGRVRPEGFRKAQRAIELASRFRLPLITLVDTPGVELDLEAERRGLGGSIAQTISSLARAPVPTVSILIGEGGSEAALAVGVADRVLMMQNAIYSPISPEIGAESEFRDASRADEMARALKLTSEDCHRMGIVDTVVPEPEGGAHGDPDEAARLLRRVLMRELASIQDIYPRTLVRRRQRKFRRMGEYGSRFRNAVKRELTTLQAAFSATMKALKGGSNEPPSDQDRASG